MDTDVADISIHNIIIYSVPTYNELILVVPKEIAGGQDFSAKLYIHVKF